MAFEYEKRVDNVISDATLGRPERKVGIVRYDPAHDHWLALPTWESQESIFGTAEEASDYLMRPWLRD